MFSWIYMVYPWIYLDIPSFLKPDFSAGPCCWIHAMRTRLLVFQSVLLHAPPWQWCQGKRWSTKVSLLCLSEAAAVKARWLRNFCPRQPVYRALKRQRSSRDRRLRSGRARWKPQSIRTRIAVTAFIPGCSLTALRALGETE